MSPPPRDRARFGLTPLLLAPIVLLYLAALVAPLAGLAVRSVTVGDGLSATNYVSLVSDPFFARILGKTLRLAAIVTIVCVVVGWPVAFCLAQAGRRMRLVMTLVILAPLFISVVVRTFGWVVILGSNGLLDAVASALGLEGEVPSLLYSEAAVVIGMVQVMLPLMIVSIQATLNGIDRSIYWAATNLGASPLRALLGVILPLSAPGILAGTSIVFGLTASAFVTPAVLGGATNKVMSVLIYQNTMVTLNFGMGGALSIALLAATLASVTAIGLAVERGLVPGVFSAQRRAA